MAKKQSGAIEWRNVRVKLGQLQPWGHNPRTSTKKQAQRILESFKTFGQEHHLLSNAARLVFARVFAQGIHESRARGGYCVELSAIHAQDLRHVAIRALVTAATIGVGGKLGIFAGLSSRRVNDRAAGDTPAVVLNLVRGRHFVFAPVRLTLELRLTRWDCVVAANGFAPAVASLSVAPLRRFCGWAFALRSGVCRRAGGSSWSDTPPNNTAPQSQQPAHSVPAANHVYTRWAGCLQVFMFVHPHMRGVCGLFLLGCPAFALLCDVVPVNLISHVGVRRETKILIAQNVCQRLAVLFCVGNKFCRPRCVEMPSHNFVNVHFYLLLSSFGHGLILSHSIKPVNRLLRNSGMEF